MRLVLMDDSKEFSADHVIDYIENIRTWDDMSLDEQLGQVGIIDDMIEYHDGRFKLDAQLQGSVEGLKDGKDGAK